MDHKEMSRRTLAVVFVWGFWLFWIIAGVMCLTTHEVTKHNVLRSSYSVEREYDCTGPMVATFVWLVVSTFPMLLERWRCGRVGRRCLCEFTLGSITSVLLIFPLILSKGETVYLGCLLLMAGLAYSCFRLRQVGLDYLEPLRAAGEQDVKEQDSAETDRTSRVTHTVEERQRTQSEIPGASEILSGNAIERRPRKRILCGVLFAVAWLLLLFQAACLVGILWAKYPRDPAISLLIYHWKYGDSDSSGSIWDRAERTLLYRAAYAPSDPLPSNASMPGISDVAISAAIFLVAMNQFALMAFCICFALWYSLKGTPMHLANIAGITAIGSLLVVATGIFIAFLPN